MPSLHEPWVSLKRLIIEQSKYDCRIDPRDFPNLDILVLHICDNFRECIRDLKYLRKLTSH